MRAKATGMRTGNESDFEPAPLTSRPSQNSSFPSPCFSPRRKALKALPAKSPPLLRYLPTLAAVRCGPAAAMRCQPGRCRPAAFPGHWRPLPRPGRALKCQRLCRAPGTQGCSGRLLPPSALPAGAGREARSSPGRAAPGRDGTRTGRTLPAPASGTAGRH